MTMGAANGHAHPWVEAAPDMQGAPNGAHEVADSATAAALAGSTLALANTAELHRALSTSQQQVVVALRQIDTLQKEMNF